MFKTKNVLLSVFLALAFVLLTLVGWSFVDGTSVRTVSAAEEEKDSADLIEEVADESAEPYGLYTSLSITLNGGDGEVWTTVRNDFTLFPSTVYVIVQLYSSSTYCEDYADMDLVAQDSTLDLNMGSSIVAKASTGGKQLYWIGRMRYKIDGKSWEERVVGPGLYSADGEFLGIL